MLGYFSAIANGVISEIQKQEQRNALLNATPEPERTALLSKWEQQDKEDREHRKALEIAEAGRARNFWGK